MGGISKSRDLRSKSKGDRRVFYAAKGISKGKGESAGGSLPSLEPAICREVRASWGFSPLNPFVPLVLYLP